MAQFKPGEGGRPKGKLNKVTVLQRNFIQSVLDQQQDKIVIELNKLTGKDYLSAINGLMEFVLPKLQRTELKNEGPEKLTIITGMQII